MQIATALAPEESVVPLKYPTWQVFLFKKDLEAPMTKEPFLSIFPLGLITVV